MEVSLFTSVDLWASVCVSAPPPTSTPLTPSPKLHQLALALCTGESLCVRPDLDPLPFISILDLAGRIQVSGLTVNDSHQVMKSFWKRYSTIYRRLLSTDHQTAALPAFLRLIPKALTEDGLWPILKPFCSSPLPIPVATAVLSLPWTLPDEVSHITTLLTACLRAIPSQIPVIQTLNSRFRQDFAGKYGLKFILAREIEQMEENWMLRAVNRVNNLKLAVIFVNGLKEIIGKNPQRSDFLAIFQAILEENRIGKFYFSPDLISELYISAKNSGVEGLCDPLLLPSSHFTHELLSNSASLANLNSDTWLCALSVAQVNPVFYAKVTEICRSMVDSASEVACNRLVSVLSGVSEESRWIRLYAIRAILADFELKCWVEKRVDAKKGVSLVIKTVKDLWYDCAEEEMSVSLLLPLNLFRVSYKTEGLDVILKSLCEGMERRQLGEVVRTWQEERVYEEGKINARLQKYAKKELDEWSRGRKLSQSCTLAEQLTSLLCFDLLRLSSSPFPLLLSLLLDRSLSPPAQELCREGIILAGKKMDFRMKISISISQLKGVFRLANSEDSYDQTIAKELLGWTEVGSKGIRVIRCEESVLEGVMVSNVEAMEVIVEEFWRRQEDELGMCVLTEALWKGMALQPAVLEETLALLTLRLWSHPQLSHLLDYINHSITWFQAIDYKQEQWSSWLKKKARPAILSAIRTRRKQRISCVFPLLNGLLTTRNLPETAVTRQCLFHLQRFITGNNSENASELMDLICSISDVKEIALWLRLFYLGVYAGKEGEVVAQLRVLWENVLSNTNSHPKKPVNDLLFLPVYDQNRPIPRLFEPFISFLQETKSSKSLFSLVTLPFKLKKWLPAYGLLGLYVVGMEGALGQGEDIRVYIEHLIRFYAEADELGMLDVKGDTVSAALRVTTEAARQKFPGQCEISGKWVDMNSALMVLQVLLSEDVQLVCTSPPSTDLLLFKSPETLLTTAWTLSPSLALRILRQCAYAFKGRTSSLNALLSQQIGNCHDSAIFTLSNIEETLTISDLCYIQPPSIPTLLQLLGSARSEVASYGHRHLLRAKETAWVFYLPQLLQLAISQTEAVALISKIMRRSKIVKQRMNWLLQALEPAHSDRLRHEFNLEPTSDLSYFQRLSEISYSLQPKDPGNSSFLIAKISATQPHLSSCIFPLNPVLQVISIDSEGCKPLRSAKRVPILVPLRCQNQVTGARSVNPVIIKINDDTRNDQLTLQFMTLAKSIFEAHDIDCYLRPYEMLPLNLKKGEILGCLMEVVPNCKSRDELWSEGFETLQGFFTAQTGDPEHLRSCFQSSMAGYSLLCYLLQIKDRHNGNLLFDPQGHIIHIDFGFILALSPGGNAGVENVEFKLTREMMDAMGDMEAFRRRFIRGFLVLREYARELTSLFELMQRSGCGCFTPGAVNELLGRFWVNKGKTKVITSLEQMIYWAQDSMYTRMYDNMQKASQNIQC